MEKKKLARIAAIILIAAAGTGIYFWTASRQEQMITASGTVEATTININARVSGVIEQMLVTEGQKVAAGELLAAIVRNDLAAQRERDAMAVAAANAQWQNLVAGPRQQELTEAASAVEQARINLQQAEADLQRAQSLASQGALSEQALEQAQNGLAIKQEQLRQAEARMQNLQAGSREQVIAAAWAELERAKAVLKTSEALLADLKLTSPSAGTVLRQYYEAGEYVPLGASLYQLADLDKLWVRVYIPTDELPGIKIGSTVSCSVSGSKQVFKGKVDKINEQGEYTPKTIQTKNERANVVYGVKISLDNSEGLLKPGMPIDVVFDGDIND